MNEEELEKQIRIKKKLLSDYIRLYNPQNEMFPPRKTKCSKRKTKCICFRHPPKPYKK